MKDPKYRVLLTMVRRISRAGRDATQVIDELELPVLATETPHLSIYRSAFGETIR